MTTANFENWAGNILDIGPIYPFVGWEVTLVIVAFVFWIGWHIFQFCAENKEFKEMNNRIGNTEGMKKALDRNSI